ncbi:MAG: IS1634 family transposase, partial [Proteobacteria bacterium]|nr:IS1634 family transposase [Pseudomonadota bacterium]
MSLVLFDVTTLSFESIDEDSLRAFGFSKDFKFNTTQVTLTLATTQEGLPIGFRLFPGNTAESKTLIASIHHWREHIPIGDVTVIGDRAMMSEANLSELEAASFHYVVAFPLRKVSKAQQALILDESGYQSLLNKDEITRYKLINLEGRRLCITYSAKRAAKDQKDRERLVNKLKKKLNTSKNVKKLVNNKGYLKYSDIQGQASVTLNEAKIAEDAKWDGLHAVILKMRPIDHFTPKRIQAHILLCYRVFTLMRHIQFRLQQSKQNMSIARIVDAVRDIQASVLVDTTNQKKYRMLSALDED